MIKWKKYICVALSAAMMSSLLAGCGDTSKKDASEDKEQAVTEASASDTLQDALTSQISADDADDADKEETVYVLADANGNANDVTVSTWLKNSDGAEGLNDKTNLTDIQNVKAVIAAQLVPLFKRLLPEKDDKEANEQAKEA